MAAQPVPNGLQTYYRQVVAEKAVCEEAVYTDDRNKYMNRDEEEEKI